MFNLEKKIKRIVEEEYGVCADCAGVFLKRAMQNIRTDGVWYSDMYYCTKHRKPYDKIISYQGVDDKGKFTSITRYFKQVEVDENGKIINNNK